MAAKAIARAKTSNSPVHIFGTIAHEYCPKDPPLRLEEVDNFDEPLLRHFQVYVVMLHGAREVQGSPPLEYDSGGVLLWVSIAHTVRFLSSLTMLVKHLL